MPQSADTLVLGATFAGLGFLAAHKDALLVERGIHAGYEFLSAMKTARMNTAAQTQAGVQLVAALQERNISLNGNGSGGLSFSAMPILFERIRHVERPPIFFADLVSVSEHPHGFTVEFSDNGGMFTVECMRILDTTGAAQSCPAFRPYITGKSIQAILGCEDADWCDRTVGTAKICRGFAKSFCFLSFPIAPEDDWFAARSALWKFWEKRPAELQGYRIARIAERFGYQYAGAFPLRCGNRLWLPSGSFENPLAAYDAGAALMESAWDCDTNFVRGDSHAYRK